MGESPMERGTPWILRHTTREVQAFVERIEYRVDVDTLHREEARTLALNDIARVELTTSGPVFVDSYRANDATGSFILIDPHTNATVAAGMVRGEVRRIAELEPGSDASARPVSPEVTWEPWNIPRPEREARNGHEARVIWLTGPSGAGKSTIARELERRLWAEGRQTMLLDGDQVRHGLNGDLGFSPEDRSENVRRVGEVARLFFEQGCVVICAFVSPFADDRSRVRDLLPPGRFTEVRVTASAETLRARDPKGLYAADARGDLATSGLRRPHERGDSLELEIDTDQVDVDEAVRQIFSRIGGARE
jgi:bifunctional enzyme CysN/CysC